MREGVQRSDSRKACRSRSPPATSTTGSGLTLILTVWSGATQSTNLLPSSNRTEETHSKTRQRRKARATTTTTHSPPQSLLEDLSLPHRSGPPPPCLQSRTAWTNFINLCSRSQAMIQGKRKYSKFKLFYTF